MPVDPCFSALLADRRNELRRPASDISLDELRRANAAFLRSAPSPVIHATVDVVCETHEARTGLRIYRPSDATRLPTIVFCHGGGFALGDLDTHDALCRTLSVATGCAVAAVDYRRAPESRFPGPPRECYAALRWLVANAARLDIDDARMTLCGDSAGANLAVAVALLASIDGPAVRHLGLLYPMTEATCDTASMQTFARGHLLTREAVQWFWELYLDHPDDAANPLASVLRADLGRLPPTSICTAEYDPLRDEGEAFAERLRAANVPVVLRRYLGMLHGFAAMPHVTPLARRAIADLATDILTVLRGDALA